MSRQIVSTILALTCVAVLNNACQQPDNTTAVTKGGKGNSLNRYGKAPNDSAKSGIPNMDKLSAAEKAKLMGKAESIKDLLEIHRQADHIFNQGWKAVWEADKNEDVSSVNSVFKVVLSDLKRVYSEQGYAKDPDLLCGRPVIELVTKKSEIINSNEVPTHFTVIANQCRSTSSIEIANFLQIKPGSWQLVYNAAELPKGVGTSQAILGGRVNCVIGIDSERRLESMKCENLAQNTTRENHAVFEQFSFSKNEQMLLKIKVSKYNALEKVKGTRELSVEISGPILWEVTEYVEEVPAAPVVVAPPVVQPAPAAPVSPATPKKKLENPGPDVLPDQDENAALPEGHGDLVVDENQEQVEGSENGEDFDGSEVATEEEQLENEEDMQAEPPPATQVFSNPNQGRRLNRVAQPPPK